MTSEFNKRGRFLGENRRRIETPPQKLLNHWQHCLLKQRQKKDVLVFSWSVLEIHLFEFYLNCMSIYDFQKSAFHEKNHGF